MQPLGKVIRNVRNPVNLPSEKSESSHESTINLVPIGGAGWGNKQATEKSLVVSLKIKIGIYSFTNVNTFEMSLALNNYKIIKLYNIVLYFFE